MYKCRVHRRGIAFIWVVLTLLCLILFCGLAMDMSIAVYSKQQLQNAADAAALAGAALVQTTPDEARQQAEKVSKANSVYGKSVELDVNRDNLSEGEVVIGRYDRDTSSFAPDMTAPNAMKVVTRRTATNHGGIDLAFGSVSGISRVDMSAEAIAMIGGGTGGGMIALDMSQECAVNFGGSVTIDVTDISVDPPEPGTIKVNSDNARAACASGGAVSIEADKIEVGGGADLGNADFDGEIETGCEPAKDPLAHLPAVDPTTMTAVPIPAKGNATVAAGYHLNTPARNGGMLTLEPGIHVFDSGSTDPARPGVALSISGNGGVQCDPAGGVLLYILQGSLELNGSGGAELYPLNAPVGNGDAVYNGVTIFQARDNLATATLGGGSGLNLLGTLYFPSNKLDIHGGAASCGNQLIANTVETIGSGEIKIMYDGRFPALGNDVFLVQ